MKLRKLTVHNFRQFYGEQSLEFSTDDKQTVTVIHGENGAGKTTLLNAFKWCLYAQTDFDTGEENILNEHAIASGADQQNIPVTVALEFDHNDFRYVAKRTQQFRKLAGMEVEEVGGAILELSSTDPSGEYETSKNPDAHIKQILPQKMHSYFFFNGERIEKLAYASASQEIQNAIRTLMGLEIVERARDHLASKVKKHFSMQVQKGASDELSGAIGQVDDIEDLIRNKNEEVAVERNNIEECDNDIGYLGNKLKSIGEIAHLEDERVTINDRVNQIENRLGELRLRLNQNISENGFLAFVQPAAERVATLLEARREKGELPYKVKQQFIDDLLERGVCICGAPLTKGGGPYAAVEGIGRSATGKGIEDAFISTSGALRLVGSSKDDMYKVVKDCLQEREDLKEERESKKGRLDNISAQLSGSEIEDAAALEVRRAQLSKRRDDAIARRGRLKGEVEELEEQLVKVRQRRDELEQESGLVNAAKRRHQLVEECARVLGQLHDVVSYQIKQKLSERVNDTFKSILQKNYWAEIDDNYCLQIYKEIPDHEPQIVYEKSTGESQVTSLSFIGSIVSLAKERQTQEASFFKGGVYPLVMDSPFGSLDPTYRTLIGRYIPDLADQIILLVSGTQWKGEVEKECKPRVGKHISLIYYAPEIGKGKESYYVRPNAEYEHTVCEEGYHG